MLITAFVVFIELSRRKIPVQHAGKGGSAAMALCYVAAGRLDGYAEQYIGQWDFMAGALIVKEAGGTVTNYDGSLDFTQGNCVVATNGVIQQDLLSAINP